MKSNFDEVKRNAALKGVAPSNDTAKPRHAWAYNAKHERTHTTPVVKETVAAPREGMPLGHNATKSFIHTRSYTPMKRERKRGY